MKKLLFLFAFLIIGSISTLFAQPSDEPDDINANVYFDYPSNGDQISIGQDGKGYINFRVMEVHPAFQGGDNRYYVRLMGPETGGTWSSWVEIDKNSRTGSFEAHRAGTYYLQASVWVEWDINLRSNYHMYSVVISVGVNDSYAPNNPSGVQLVSNSDPLSHPTITWNFNTEADMHYYEIWRKVPQYSNSYSLIETTTSNSFIDLEYFNAPNAGDFQCYYKIKAKDYNGNFSQFTNEISTRAESVMKNNSKDMGSNVVSDFKLFENFPNPFNPTTCIKYQIKERGFVSLKVFNLSGEEVATLVNETKAPGEYTVVFNAATLSSGVYIYSLRANNFIQNNKMTLMK